LWAKLTKARLADVAGLRAVGAAAALLARPWHRPASLVWLAPAAGAGKIWDVRVAPLPLRCVAIDAVENRF
jgi:hypothetical protein